MSAIYSHSRLSSFENCPKQFHFRYVLKLPSETESIEAFVGKRVHDVLERLYRFVLQGMVPSLEKVIWRFHQLWEESYDAERVRVVRTGTPLSYYRQLGARCLSNYYRRHYPFDGDETLAIEERVLFDLDDTGRYRMQGFIDRVVRTPDGTIEIQDYKTGQRVPSQKRLDADRQLALYQLGLRERFGDAPVRLVWHYVASGQMRSSSRTAEELDALRGATIGLIDRIQQEQAFEPKRQPLCDWCEYRSACPLWAETKEAEPKADHGANSLPPEPQPRAVHVERPASPAGDAPAPPRAQLDLL